MKNGLFFDFFISFCNQFVFYRVLLYEGGEKYATT